jgi:hypothetical protein
MNEYDKPFNYWKTQEVEEIFRISPSKNDNLFSEWLSADALITTEKQKQLNDLQNHLISRIDFWNKTARQFYFTGSLMNLVEYDNDFYNSFWQQQLSVKINEEITVSGNLDFLVATGKQIPRTPFFALHEYKPEPNVSTGPMGQLLIGMVAAQQANQAKGYDYPLYGTYVVGRLWFFVLLNGKTYSKSLAYDATQQDLTAIFHILKKVNDYIQQSLSTELEKV